MLTSYMPPISCYSCVRITGSVGDLCSGGRGRVDTQALEQRIGAAASGLEPDLVEPQDVLVGMRVGGLGQLVEGIHHGLEFLRQLREDVAQHPALAPGQHLTKDAVGAPAHRDVIVDVDELAREALRKEAGDEERDIAKPLQVAVAVVGRARLE